MEEIAELLLTFSCSLGIPIMEVIRPEICLRTHMHHFFSTGIILIARLLFLCSSYYILLDNLSKIFSFPMLS